MQEFIRKFSVPLQSCQMIAHKCNELPEGLSLIAMQKKTTMVGAKAEQVPSDSSVSGAKMRTHDDILGLALRSKKGCKRSQPNREMRGIRLPSQIAQPPSRVRRNCHPQKPFGGGKPAHCARSLEGKTNPSRLGHSA